MAEKYSNIAVIYGSDSSECEVSCRSGEFVASRVDDTKYSVYEVFARHGRWELVAFRKKDSMRVTFPEGSRPRVDRNDFSVNVYGENIKLDYAYVVQHGRPGENGLLQGYLEMLGIPYSSCSAFVSSVVFDKYACKCYLRNAGLVNMAPEVFIRKGSDVDACVREVVSTLGFPVFVKPTDGGSSFGITKVSSPEGLSDAISYAFSEGETLIIEQGVVGRELTCAAYLDGGEVKALPVIEIVTENDYFDYDAKYNGYSQEICPAPIPEDLEKLIKETTCNIYRHLGCKGVVRIDYISAEDGLYFLEVNNIPGMTSASLVPRMVRTAGMDMTAFISTIIENS
ncbi:MAG: D-alanine--D-alanine ligase [Bacteroidales bacterium]|nr:D-alanine--D-alanine ligase [Bacteroidales bacterium]